jgi:hypothetical protein
MNEGKLEEFLLEITLSAVLRNAQGIDDVTEMLYNLDAAVKSRKVVDCVQFEGLWNENIDDSPHLFVNFKLSPDVCEAGFEDGTEFHELTWNLFLPNAEGIDPEDRPETALDWLALAEIDINLENDDIYDELTRLIVLDVEEDD